MTIVLHYSTNDVRFIPHWTEAMQRASATVFSSWVGGCLSSSILIPVPDPSAFVHVERLLTPHWCGGSERDSEREEEQCSRNWMNLLKV